MELNEMEKKQLFQIEGACHAKVLIDLYMTVRYSNNAAGRTGTLCLNGTAGRYAD